MKTLLSICIIFSITIATGTCLVCETCNEDDCNDMTPMPCKSSVKRCFNSLEVKKTEEGETQRIRKSCAENEKLCDLTFSMSAGYEVYYMSKCCNEDQCNREKMEMPPINQTEIKNQCPVCNANAESCTPKGNMTCRGDQTACTKFSVKGEKDSKNENWSFQGCTTENFCNGDASIYYSSIYKNGQRACSWKSMSSSGSISSSSSSSWSSSHESYSFSSSSSG